MEERTKKTVIEMLNKFSAFALIPDYILNDFKKRHNLSPTVEVGKVYKSGLARVMITDSNLMLGYGIGFKGDWTKSINCNLDDWESITQEEWIEVLKKEGDKYIGKTVKCLCNKTSKKVCDFSSFWGGGLWYHSNDCNNLQLMKEGVWAEIVSDEIIEQIHQLQKQLDSIQDKINELTK